MNQPASPPPAASPPSGPLSPYQAAAAQLTTIHRELRGALANVLHHAADPSPATTTGLAGLSEYTTLFSRFLLAHHHAEDTHLFPALRREGKLRTSDLDFLAGLERDHVEVHTLCEHLIDRCRSGSPDRAALRRQAADLQQLLLPHLTAEETGLAADRLPHLVSQDALLAIQRQVQTSGGPQRQQVLRLFEHPLHLQHASHPGPSTRP
jgi:hypothetical protein